MSHKRKLMDTKMNSDCGDTPAHCSDSRESNVFDEVKVDDCKETDKVDDIDKTVAEWDGEHCATGDANSNFNLHESDINYEHIISDQNPEDQNTNYNRHSNELRSMLSDFQDICHVQLERIAEFSASINNGEEQIREETHVVKMRKKKSSRHKPHLVKNLIVLCMMVVLLMQIHMYILLYSKFNRMHNELKMLSCVVYGKNCPNSRTAYECLSNKVDFIDSEHMRSMDILHKDMEEVTKTMENISQLIYTTTDRQQSEQDTLKSTSNKPPRTGSIYPVNP